MERAPAPKRGLYLAQESLNGIAVKRTKVPSELLPASHVSFRMVVHESRIGGIIGKSGSIIKQLQLETSTKIRIEDAPAPEVLDRVIVVTGSGVVKPSVMLMRRAREGKWGEDEVEVSAAQEGVIRVFERVLEVAVETDGVYIGPGRVVSCRLLAEVSQMVGLVGKGGMVVEKIRAETGCKVRVYAAEKLQFCADPSDDMIEIEGEVSAVKKALVAVLGCMQQCVLAERNDVMEKGYVEIRNGRGLMTSLPSSIASNSTSYGRFSVVDGARDSVQNAGRQEEVSFRILCPSAIVGSVIGKGGSIIRVLQSETGTTISIGPLIADCDERLITVKAMENVDSQYSQTIKALGLVFSRFAEATTEKGSEPDSKKGTSVVARLIVPTKQVGSLLGKGGVIISEMRRITRTSIHIMKSDEIPKCASEGDQVVQITGESVRVQDAIFHVTSRLRDTLFPRKSLNNVGTRSISYIVPEASAHGRLRESIPFGLLPADAVSHRRVKHSSQLHINDYHRVSPELDRHVSPRSWASQTTAGPNVRDLTEYGGVSSNRHGLDFGSGTMAATVTNTTIEIKVPDRLLGAVYGENGSNLARLRQISGARVILQEPHPGMRERTFIISGTPDETQAAQSLLQAFILTGSS